MNDVILTTGEDVNLTIVGGPTLGFQNGPTLKFLDVITVTNTFDYVAYVESLDPYSSDEAAILGGMSVGEVYRTTDSHETLPGGMPKIIRPI